MKNKINITNNWISGFTQSDGSFTINFDSTTSGIPIRPVPIFNLTQSNVDYDLFIEIQSYRSSIEE